VDETQYCWDKVVNTHGLRPDEGTCLQVSRVAAKFADSKLATDVIRQLSNNGYSYKEHYFVPLMEAFVAKDDLKSAFDVLDIMRVSGVPPSMRSTLSVSEKISSNIETVDKAYYLLEEMKKEGKPVDVTAFNIVIAACGLAKDIGRSVATYREAANLGVVPNVDTFNAVLDACIQTDMKGMGQIVIDELKKAKVAPNVDTFSKMISLVCRQSNYEDAFVYLEEMKSHGVIPPRRCYIVLAKKLANERDPRFHIALEEMETYGYKSDYLKELWN
jgi:pentatricopeptide repeat protein